MCGEQWGGRGAGRCFLSDCRGRESIKKGGAHQTSAPVILISIGTQLEFGSTVCSLSQSVTTHHQPGSGINTSVVQVTILNYRQLVEHMQKPEKHN